MKKKFLTLIALLSIGGSVMAGNKPIITVADVEALPGETVSFAVNMVDGKASTYTAMTLYAYFPTTGFTTTETYSVSSAWTGATGVVGDINTTTGLATIPFASANAITGSEVENLVTVSFTVDNAVALGEYTVTLKETMFEYNTSDKDYADDVTFKIKVVSAHSVVLDELSTVAPEAADGVNVTVRRTITAGNWSSICLPFAMTEAQVKAAFGDDVEIKDFNGIESTYDGENCTAINVKFVSTTAIEANHPYIIKVSSNITEFTADNVNIAPEEIPAVDKDKTRIGSKYYYNSFIGTYVANTEVPEMALFLSGSNFAYSKGKTKMKAFRGYFSFLDLLADYDNASARIMMVFDEGTTGINENMRMKRESDADGYYYNLSGQRVENPGKGLYIKNNKKVIIK